MQAIGKEMLEEFSKWYRWGTRKQGDRYVFSGQSDQAQPFTMSTTTVDRGLSKTLDDKQALGSFSTRQITKRQHDADAYHD